SVAARQTVAVALRVAGFPPGRTEELQKVSRTTKWPWSSEQLPRCVGTAGDRPTCEEFQTGLSSVRVGVDYAQHAIRTQPRDDRLRQVYIPHRSLAINQ